MRTGAITPEETRKDVHESKASVNGGLAHQHELWGNFDPRKEPLETEVLKEWEQDGVVTRLVRYQVGTFKGTASKVAARESRRSRRP